MKKYYNPQPAAATADIELPAGLDPLLESMAGHIHDTWAMQRLATGWKWGPERNDTRKTHPCLVPYDELPETEKEYDRNTAIETLKYIISRGYDIIRKEPEFP